MRKYASPSPLLKGEDRHEEFDSYNGSSVIAKYKPKHTYQLWQARNKFMCGGRCISGPDRYRTAITFFLIFIPAALFYIFETIPVYDHYGLPPLIIYAVLFVPCLLLLFLTACTDPGIVPRFSRPGEDIDSMSADRKKGRDTTYGRFIVRLKYCDTCHFYRPHRVHHCNTCDTCVERFDHHCPWVGNCIGRRNYRFFYTFVCFLSVFDVYNIVYSFLALYGIVRDEMNKGEGGGGEAWINAIAANPVSLVIMVYAFVLFFFVFGLCGFHSYLIVHNKTTYEHIKKTFKNANPYYEGCRHSCVQTLCTSRGESQVHARSPLHLAEQHHYQAQTIGGGSIAPPTSQSYNADDLPPAEADRFDPEDLIESSRSEMGRDED
uniref:Palmitoyltransferase n=1 Tax=Palpitomonas bilix TaxID=652834 RepID=A0A7S3CV07_9EUKA